MARSLRIVGFSAFLVASISPLGAADRIPVDRAAFSGPAGWKAMAGSTRTTASDIAVGEAFAEQQVAYARTGRFRDAVVSGGSIAKETIEAGLPAYAVEMQNYGVGWCTPGGDARDLGARLASSNKERCIFFGEDGEPFRTQGYDGKSAFAAAAMTGMYRVRSAVNVVEQPVDFGRRFRVVATLGKVAAKQVRIDYWFDDGTNRTRLMAHKLKPAADGSFSLPLWGGAVRLRPEGARMRVETVTELRDILSDQPELRGVRIYSPSVNIIFI